MWEKEEVGEGEKKRREGRGGRGEDDDEEEGGDGGRESLFKSQCGVIAYFLQSFRTRQSEKCSNKASYVPIIGLGIRWWKMMGKEHKMQWRRRLLRREGKKKEKRKK